jgi:hypothetical protein
MSDESKPTKRKPGRKPKPAAEKVGAPILVRATPAERRAIHRRAAAAGRSLSRYLVAVGTRDGQPATPEEREELGRLLFELHKVGTNLNQIAHAMNAARLSGQEGAAEADIASAVSDVRATVAAVRERLKA